MRHILTTRGATCNNLLLLCPALSHINTHARIQTRARAQTKHMMHAHTNTRLCIHIETDSRLDVLTALPIL